MIMRKNLIILGNFILNGGLKKFKVKEVEYFKVFELITYVYGRDHLLQLKKKYNF